MAFMARSSVPGFFLKRKAMPEKKITILISGMHCVNCAATIEKKLLKTPGVKSAAVSFANEKASVMIDPDVAGSDALKAAVESAGFKFLGLEGMQREFIDADKAAFLKSQAIKSGIGFIAGFALMAAGMIKTGMAQHRILIFQFLISTLILPYISFPIFKAAYISLLNRNLTMDIMYAMGIGVAYTASAMAMAGLVFSPDFMFFDTAVLLAAFLTFGRYLEMRARSRTTTSLRALMDLCPKRAIVVLNGNTKEIPAENVVAGDMLQVKPGDKIPVDGTIISGESHVDESMISGEAFPMLKKPGDNVIAGTVNKNGIFVMKAVKVGNETILAQITRLVSDAQNTKPPIQKIADRAVSLFIPVVLGIGLLTFILWHFVFGGSLEFALSACISVLVAACPCALGLATPTALSAGIGRAAELGILIKNGDALEMLEKISVVVFDKTGTITYGEPVVTDILPVFADEHILLTLAASLEQYSRHPLAKAILEKAMEMKCEYKECSGIDTVEGKGINGFVDNIKTYIGNVAFMQELGIDIGLDLMEKLSIFSNDGKSVLLIANNGKLVGAIACADSIKKSSSEAISALHDKCIKTALVSGDNEKTATAIAKQAGIEEVYANILPAGKAPREKIMQEQGGRTAFVGDGINDAVALAQADIGIAMNNGTDVAVESADIVLMRNDCMDVVSVLNLGKAVMSQIRINIFWAFAYNSALIPFAAGLFYPAFHVMLRPEWAGLAMAMSSVTVVLLSLRLKKIKPMKE